MGRELQTVGDLGTVRPGNRQVRAGGDHGECSGGPYRDAGLNRLASGMVETFADPYTGANAHADCISFTDAFSDSERLADPVAQVLRDLNTYTGAVSSRIAQASFSTVTQPLTR